MTRILAVIFTLLKLVSVCFKLLRFFVFLTVCPYIFVGFASLQLAGGYQEQYPPPVDEPICGYCFKVFRDHRGLRVHVRDLHEAVNVQHECSICHKMFRSINTLHNHRSLYHKGQK